MEEINEMFNEKKTKTMEEINDLYHLKDKIGDFLISHHYSEAENKSNTERLMQTLNKIWDELDKYRDKHILNK